MDHIAKCTRLLIDRKDLTHDQMYKLMFDLSNAESSRQAAILALLSSKKESVDELIGALSYFLEHSKKFDSKYDIVDIVGTGGDNKGTFNISTTVMLILAGCDVYVSKHGGRASTSKSGSADVAECLGIDMHSDPKDVLDALSKNNFAYLWAPLFNNSFKSFSTIRKELNFPTIFNILGPLSNPMQPKRRVIGVYRKDLVMKVAKVLQWAGDHHSIVVRGEDGLDEFSISAPSYYVELLNGKITEHTITPENVGMQTVSIDNVLGGDHVRNAEITKGMCNGQISGAMLDIVLLNAAAGLIVSDVVPNFMEGIKIARNAIFSKKCMTFN